MKSRVPPWINTVPPEDVIRLRHILDAAREAVAILGDTSREELAGRRVISLALVKTLEIIGEAANHVTGDTRSLHPELPWRTAVGMRNRLIHAYFDIDHAVLWDTITHDLPPLIRRIEKILGR